MKLITNFVLLSSLLLPPHIDAFTHHRRNGPSVVFQSISLNQIQTRSHLSMVSSDKDIDSLGLTPQLETMTKAFSSIPDEKTRYKQLLYMANQLQPMDSSLMVPQNKVPGCLSTVYVDCTADENEDGEIVVNYVGDSDGLLTKGLIALLVRGLSGCTPEQIQKVNPEFISVAKITQSLTPGRNNGFLNMLAVMKAKAEQAIAKNDSSNDAADNTASSAESDVITTFEEIQDKPMYNEMMLSLLKLKPSKLDLIDESHQHAGHAGSKGWEESGESHFNLEIVSEAFSGMARVKRHQLIYLLLGETMSKIHALSISAKTKEEV